MAYFSWRLDGFTHFSVVYKYVYIMRSFSYGVMGIL